MDGLGALTHTQQKLPHVAPRGDRGFVEIITVFLESSTGSQSILTRTLLVALSLACLEMSFNVKGPGAVILLFRLEYKTSVVCHNVYTQKVKIARRDRLHILASNRCETFENLLRIDIAPVLFQGFYTRKIER